MPRWNGKWPGGRTYVGRDGETVYWLDRAHDGTRYGFRLDAGNLKQAMAELALFERDPKGYVSDKEAKKEREKGSVVLDDDLLDRFDQHQLGEGRDPVHVNKTSSTSSPSRSAAMTSIDAVGQSGSASPTLALTNVAASSRACAAPPPNTQASPSGQGNSPG